MLTVAKVHFIETWCSLIGRCNFSGCVQAVIDRKSPRQSGGGSVHSPMEVHSVESVPLSRNPSSQLMLQLELKLNSSCGWKQCREPWRGAVSTLHSWAGTAGNRTSDPENMFVLNTHAHKVAALFSAFLSNDKLSLLIFQCYLYQQLCKYYDQ